jgi:hypothetical protein
MTTDERAMGVFILPLLVALQAIPASDRRRRNGGGAAGPLFGVHVSSLLFAYASFALACVVGITYVLLFKEIKAKHLGFFYARLPSLQVLDRMNQRRDRDRLDFPDGGHDRRCGLGAAGARRVRGGRSAGSGDVAAGPQDLRGPRVLGRVFVRAVCGAADRMGRASRGLPLGARVRDRAAEFRADQLFPDEESQFLKRAHLVTE